MSDLKIETAVSPRNQRRVYFAHLERYQVAERTALKEAGFWWHPGPGQCFSSKSKRPCEACDLDLRFVWWTPFKEKAARLSDHASPEAKPHLEEHHEAIAASVATDADIDLPGPNDRDYYPYQRAGVAYAMNRPATLIADEMGLGKTIQGLGIMNTDPSIHLTLCVVPASLRFNWAKEAAAWLVRPHKVTVLDSTTPKYIQKALLEEHGAHILRPAALTADYFDDGNDHLLILSYEAVKGKVEKLLSSTDWDLFLMDEAHLCKNPKAKRTQKLLGFYDRKNKVDVDGIIHRARRRCLLTGTPLLNKPVELHPLLAALDRKTWGNFFRFAKRYCNAHQERILVAGGHGETKAVWNFNGSSNLAELQERLRSTIMIRRLKKDVLTELPTKTRQVVSLPPNGCSDIIKRESAAYAKHEALIAKLDSKLHLAELDDDKDAYAAAAADLEDALEVAFEEMSEVRHEVAVAKIPHVIEHVDAMLESGIKKIILFTWHRDVAAAFRDHWASNSVKLIGGTSVGDAEEAKRRYIEDDDCNVFIGNIKAAGVGHTLVVGHHVVFAELDWVPGNVTQAEDRAHRPGQTMPVLIQHLVFEGSTDGRMVNTLIRKQRVSDAALDNPLKLKVEVGENPKRSVTPQGLPSPKYPVPTPEQRDAVAACLQSLAGMCDGARERDGCGFNGTDTNFGKSLAARSMDRPLSDGQCFAAGKMVLKYHRQLDAGTLALVKSYVTKPKAEVA